MITWEEVLRLREAIPPRHPRGSPANEARCKPGHAFGVALERFKLQYEISWFDYMKERVYATR